MWPTGDGKVVDGDGGPNGGFIQKGGALPGKESGGSDSNGGRDNGELAPYSKSAFGSDS